jgi:hypothetical protein
MAVTVLSKAIADGGSVYYSEAWRNTIEQHLSWLLGQSTNVTVPLVPSDTIKYQFDFFGLCQEYGYAPYLHWIILRMNGLTGPTEYCGQFSMITVPNSTVVNQLLAVFNAIQQKVKNIA